MKLSTILAGLPVHRPTHAASSDPDIWSLSEDSRRVKQGALFFARAGTKSDGRAFIADAIQAGAVAVVAPRGTAKPESAPASLAWIEADDAPLVAALAVIGQSGDVVRGAAALFSLSLGMGVPLLIVGASAGQLLPKAGAWMDSVKAVFGDDLGGDCGHAGGSSERRLPSHYALTALAEGFQPLS
jgi:hypothetical protein